MRMISCAAVSAPTSQLALHPSSKQLTQAYRAHSAHGFEFSLGEFCLPRLGTHGATGKPWARPRRPFEGCPFRASESISSVVGDEWIQKLPDKKKPLYSHSLPCIEAWLKSLGFFQTKEDRAVWLIERPDWHAQLSLDITDLYIRYLKIGPGNLERDVERKFSYALSREDLENAILGGP